MERRRFLMVAGVAALSGCTGQSDRGGTDSDTDASAERSTVRHSPVATEPTSGGTAADTAPTATPTAIARRGIPPTICERSPSSGADIYAIVDPEFDSDWRGLDVKGKYTRSEDHQGIGADHTVVGMTDGERARAYPLSILFLHEIVNDTFGGPVLVTYCPLCKSGVVAERRVAGQETTFLVTGLLWIPPRVQGKTSIERGGVFGATLEGGSATVELDGNLVMQDEATGSYWSQLLARAICGSRRGDRLSIRPSTVTTWAEWQRDHPDTDVLLPPPHSQTTRQIGEK